MGNADVATDTQHHPDASEHHGTHGGQGVASVDVHALADRVYKLMLDEVRLAKARGAPSASSRKG
jgi:hypothetical protein